MKKPLSDARAYIPIRSEPPATPYREQEIKQTFAGPGYAKVTVVDRPETPPKKGRP